MNDRLNNQVALQNQRLLDAHQARYHAQQRMIADKKIIDDAESDIVEAQMFLAGVGLAQSEENQPVTTKKRAAIKKKQVRPKRKKTIGKNK